MVDHLMQTLIVQRSFYDAGEAETSEGAPPAASGIGRAVADSADAEELPQIDPLATLRSMRRTGPLAELSQEAQEVLLGGTLYEFSDISSAPFSTTAASPGELSLSDVQMAPGATFGETLGVLDATLSS